MAALTFVAVALAAASVAGSADATAPSPRLPGKIAFSDRLWWPPPEGDAWEILVFAPDDPRPQAVTKDLPCGDAYSPTWSRHGSMIAFICSGHPWVIWHDGTGGRQVADGLADVLAWSPDRRALASIGERSLWVVDVWGGRRRRLARSFGYDVQWSPGGQTIAFTRSDQNAGIWLIGRDGHGLHQLTNGDDGPFEWSPAGRQILFTREHRNAGVWIVRRDGKAPRRLVRGENIIAKWSPDGNWIAFSNQRGLYVMKARHGHARRIGKGDRGFEWSPDSRWLATSSDLPGQSGVWAIAREGGPPRRLICCLGQLAGLSWAP